MQKKLRFFTSTQSSLCFFFLMFAHPLSLFFIRIKVSGSWGYNLSCNFSSSLFFFSPVLLYVVAGCVNAILFNCMYLASFISLRRFFVSVTLIKIFNNTLLVFGACLDVYLCT